MTDYYAPGVYVKEIQTGTRPITAVGTSTAGFLGVAPDPKALAGEARYITNWTQFKNLYFPKSPNKEKQLLLGPGTQTAESVKKAGEAEVAALVKEAALVKAAGEAKEAALLEKAGSVKTAGSKMQEGPEKKAGEALEKELRKEAVLLNKEACAKEAALLQEAALVKAAALLKEAELTTNTALTTDTAQAERPFDPDEHWNDLAHAVYGFFLNGGSACYVYNLGEETNLTKGLEAFERIDAIAIVAAPGRTDSSDYESIKSHCEKMEDRVGILDGPESMDNYTLTLLKGDTYTGKLLPDGKPLTEDAWQMAQPSDRGFVTLYSPWLKVANPNPKTNEKQRTETVPPSGHIAGIWARSDAFRGVHKAPANEVVRGALDLAYAFSHQEQERLNPRGVNCIRYFTGEGYLVWGARTLFPKGKELWKYLNVRRLFNQIEESIAEGTRWIVFEPNDRPLWQAIKRDITAFLMGFWRAGALMGRTPEEAFFVKCDEENNPFDRIIKGEVHIDIGIAPVRPAEFVIFQISQYEAGSDVKEKA